jgi:acetate kinase
MATRLPLIPVAISARHVHLTPLAVEQLFGPGAELTVHKPLSQPGHFAAEQQVDLVGPRRTIQGVRVLGPCRSRCQVEVARTDEFFLGVDAPVRASGDLDGTPGITLVGPAGTLELEEGLICAQRHIHMNPQEAESLGVKNGDLVEVALDTDGRDLIFGDVLVRVSEGVHLEMHLDTDEGNAAEIEPGDKAVLAPTSALARLRVPRVG